MPKKYRRLLANPTLSRGALPIQCGDRRKESDPPFHVEHPERPETNPDLCGRSAARKAAQTNLADSTKLTSL